MTNSNTIDVIVSSISQTHAVARSIAKELKPGSIVLLEGELGAGKTEFVRGFAAYWGVEDMVASPSFILENVYECGQHKSVRRIHHWDLYRTHGGIDTTELTDIAEVEQGIVIVEWAERCADLAERCTVIVKFAFINTLNQDDPFSLYEDNQQRLIQITVHDGAVLEKNIAQNLNSEGLSVQERQKNA